MSVFLVLLYVTVISSVRFSPTDDEYHHNRLWVARSGALNEFRKSFCYDTAFVRLARGL